MQSTYCAVCSLLSYVTLMYRRLLLCVTEIVSVSQNYVEIALQLQSKRYCNVLMYYTIYE